MKTEKTMVGSSPSNSSWLDRIQKEAHDSELDHTNTTPRTFILISLSVTVVVFTICSWIESSIFTTMAVMGLGSHWIGFLVSSVLIKTNKFFDIIEDISLIAMFCVSFAASTTGSNRPLSLRQKLAHLCALIWTIRLMAFVGYRVMIRGRDFRFDKLSKGLSYSFFAWTCGGLWCWLSGFALWNLVATDENSFRKMNSLDFLDYFALTLFIISLSFETVADVQKYRFNASHPSGTNPKWIETGLWSLSRHPNYCGEIMVWVSISLLSVGGMDALPILSSADVVALLVPPIWSFVFLLFTSLMLLEKRADGKWGTNKNYLAYKRSTPVLFPGM